MDETHERYLARPSGTVWLVRRFTAKHADGPWTEDLAWRETDAGKVEYQSIGLAIAAAVKLDPRVIAARDRMAKMGAELNAEIQWNLRNGMTPLGRIVMTQRVDGEQ